MRRCYNASCRLVYNILYLDIVSQVSVTVHLSSYIVYEKHKLKFLLRADLSSDMADLSNCIQLKYSCNQNVIARTVMMLGRNNQQDTTLY